jgi:ankyrin repeat protein
MLEIKKHDGDKFSEWFIALCGRGGVHSLTQILMSSCTSNELKVLLAAADGDWPLLEQLLAAQPALLEAANEWGWTPLMQAARGGHVSLVASLVSLGADVTTINKLGIAIHGMQRESA